MAITLNDNIKVLAPKPTDTRSLDATNAVFASVADANAAIPYDQRHIRLTTNLVDGEYWYRDGKEDADLVPKNIGIDVDIDVSEKLDKGNYTGTAQDLKHNIDTNNTNINLSLLTANGGVLTGIDEDVNGYYNFNDGIFVPDNNYRSTVYTVNSSVKYFATGNVAGSLVALAIYYDINNVKLGMEFEGNNGAPVQHTDKLLTLPPNTAFVKMTNRSTTEYSVLKVISSAAKRVDLDAVKERVLLLESLEFIPFQNELINGYYNAITDSGFTPHIEYTSVKFTTTSSPFAKYYATGKVLGHAAALAVYYNINNVKIGEEFIGNGDFQIEYTNQLLTLPPNTAYIGMTNRSRTEYSTLVLNGNSVKQADLDAIKNRTSLLEESVFFKGKNEANNGYYDFNNGSFNGNSAFRSTKYAVNTLTKYYATSNVFGSVVALAVYYNAANVRIGSELPGNNETATQYTDKLLTLPTNTAFIGLTNYSATVYPVLKRNKDLEITPITAGLTETNVWKGKKIAWYGTSIPAGYPSGATVTSSYANGAASRLGAIIQNYCIPNGIIRKFKSSGLATGRASNLSFTNTAGSSNYLTQMVNLIGTVNEPDLFVFDYSVNDFDEDSTDIQAGGWDFTSESLSTFHGSINFVIKQLLTAKPKARIALFCHFSDDAAAIYTNWGKTNELIEKIGNYWGIPVCKVHQKSGFIKKNGINTITAYMPDNIHPATDPTGRAVERLTNIAHDFLKGI